ncbi:MAG: hypothetical protein HUJ61_06805 [Bacilli bacterium]|nr:hypothetical protein [Bacilli bacterium]
MPNFFNSFPTVLLIISYLVLAVAIMFLSKKLADYVDALDKKTKISGAFIGAVMLAAVTSLPELFTSISATILLPDSANLVTGNILGSNLFNLAIIGVAMIIFFRLMAKSKIEYKSHFTVIVGVLGIYGIMAYGIFGNNGIQPIFGNSGYISNINWIVILIVIVYGITIFFQPKTSEDDDEEEKVDPYANITLKQVIIRFIICALLLVATSILITYSTDAIAAKFSLDATLAGAIFLAVATSLPELVSTFALCKKGNFNAALGDIIGSCLFNFLIISIAEFLSYKTSLLPGYDIASSLHPLDLKNAVNMLWLTVVVLVFLTISLLVHFFTTKKEKAQTKWHYALYIAVGVILTSGYIVFLCL